MTLTDYVSQEKNEVQDLGGLKIALIHRYNDSKTTEKNAEEDWPLSPEMIISTQGSTE